MQGDSKLVIQQINGKFSLKESTLAFYPTAVQKLVKHLLSVQFDHVSLSHNKHVDALACIQLDIQDDVAEISHKEHPTSYSNGIHPDPNRRRRRLVKVCHAKPSLAIFHDNRKRIQGFAVVERELYYNRGYGGILAQAISKDEARLELECAHDLSCGDNDIGL